MKLVRQIVLALGLIAAFICLTVFSSAEYPASNSNLKVTDDKLPLIGETFSGLDTILSYTDKIPLLKGAATTTETTTIVNHQIATTTKEADKKINNFLNKADIKGKEAELVNSVTTDSLKSVNFSDLFNRLKKALNRDWSRF